MFRFVYGFDKSKCYSRKVSRVGGQLMPAFSWTSMKRAPFTYEGLIGRKTLSGSGWVPYTVRGSFTINYDLLIRCVSALASMYPNFVLNMPNLMIILVFPRVGRLITIHRGWGIWSLASIPCHLPHLYLVATQLCRSKVGTFGYLRYTYLLAS